MKQEKVRDTLNRLSKGLFRVLSEKPPCTRLPLSFWNERDPENQLYSFKSNPKIPMRFRRGRRRRKKKQKQNNLREGKADLAKVIVLGELRNTHDVRTRKKSKRLTKWLANLLSRKSMTVLEVRNRSRHSGMKRWRLFLNRTPLTKLTRSLLTSLWVYASPRWSCRPCREHSLK